MQSGRTVEQLPSQGLARSSKKRTPGARARDRVVAILDKATALVAMADDGGALFYLNPAGRAMLGLAPDDDVADIALIECMAPSVRTGVAEAAIPAALRRGAWSGECVLQSRDAGEIEVSLLITAHRDAKGRLEGLSLLAQDMGAWTSTTAALRFTRRELLRLSALHMAIQEDERRRIAADLHDGLGQSLGLVIASLENASSLLGQGEAGRAADCLARLNPRIRNTLDELRRIAMNLRPATLDSLGILATMSWHLREIEAACPGTRIERRFDVEETDVPIGLRTPIFRILQEADSNAIKHGKADRITVRLAKARGVLELAIEDNGKGFDPRDLAGNAKLNGGMGLQSMRERAELSCGICEIRSAPGEGTRVSVKWPAAALGETGLDRAALPQSGTRTVHRPHFFDFESARDLEMLHNLSVCVACVRSIRKYG